MLIDHEVLATALKAQGKRVPKAALSDTNKEGPRGSRGEQVLRLFARNDAVKPVRKSACAILSRAFLLLYFFVPLERGSVCDAILGVLGCACDIDSWTQANRVRLLHYFNPTFVV